jgi:hypothetical protein
MNAGTRARFDIGALRKLAAERAIDRIWKAMGEMDDSDGHCGAVLATARDIHRAAASAIRPDPLQLARSLFAHETADEHDIFAGAADMYADVLGAAGLAEYRRLAAEAWAKLPPAAGSGRRPDGYFALKAILDHFAERDGDVQARIALRKAALPRPGPIWSLRRSASRKALPTTPCAMPRKASGCSTTMARISA